MPTISEFFAHHAARLVDAPPLEEAGDFARYIGRAKSGETWSDFTYRITAEREIAARASDIRLPSFAEEPDGWLFYASPDAHDPLVQAFDLSLDHTISTDVFRKAAELIPYWLHMPVHHDPNSAEFVWARARMVFAPLGESPPDWLIESLVSRYPLCPFVSSDGREEIRKAHAMCGWPATLVLADWKRLAWDTPGDATEANDWQRVAGFFHLMRHTRIDDDRKITVGYRGVTTAFPPETSSNVFGHWGKQRALFFGALGVSSAKARPIEHAAFAAAIRQMTAAQLVRRKPITDLPANVLAGPWSRCSPDPQGANGLRLDGVWVASGGRVKQHVGDEADVLDWQWNLTTAHEADALEARDAFLDVLPRTYELAFPSDIFFDTFPQLERLDGPEGIAMRALFDAPILASVIRRDVRELAHEFPLVAFLPAVPTLDKTTNHGKTAAAHTYARALSHTVISLGASDSGSAPDVRSVADVIRTYGTAYLDEFRMPRNKNHVLSRENLQSLCTGGSVTAGRVLENSGTLRLRHSLVLSAKGLDTTPDILNRTIPWFLGELNEATRADPRKLSDILSGRVAMRMKLAAIAMVEKYDLANMGEVGGGNAMRFPVHRALAMKLAIYRGIDLHLVDEVFAAMQRELTDNCKAADESGVLSSLEEGRVLRLRWASFWEDLDPAGYAGVLEYLVARGQDMATGGWAMATATQLMEARMRASDMSDKPFCELLTRISGQNIRCGNKIVTMALAEEMKKEFGQDEIVVLPGLPGMQYEFRWTLRREHVVVCMRKRLENAA